MQISTPVAFLRISFRVMLVSMFCFLSQAAWSQEDSHTTYTSNMQRGMYTTWDQDWVLPEAGSGAIIFQATAASDISVAISDDPSTKNPMYEIVIGGWANTKTVIRRASQGPILRSVAAKITVPLKPESFWVVLDNRSKTISVGRGTVPGTNILLEYRDEEFLQEAQFVSFSSWTKPVKYTQIVTEEYPKTTYNPTPEPGLTTTAGNMGVYKRWGTAYQFGEPGRGAIVFAAKASNDIHVALSSSRETRNPMYEIVMGGSGNQWSAIRRSAQGTNLGLVYQGVRNPGERDYYWVAVDKNSKRVSAGFGQVVGQNTLVEYTDPNFLADVQFITMSDWDKPITYDDIKLQPLPNSTVATPAVAGDQGVYKNWANAIKLTESGFGSVVFAAKATNDIHIALSASQQTQSPMYEIVIGANANTQTLIRRSSQGASLASFYIGLRYPGERDYYWVLADKNTKRIAVGFGQIVGESQIAEYTDQNFLADVQYVTFTGWDKPVVVDDMRPVALKPVVVAPPVDPWPTDKTWVKTEKPEYAANEGVVVVYNKIDVKFGDWISIALSSVKDGEWGKWEYLDHKVPSGSVNLGGFKPGTYEVRLYHGANSSPYARYKFTVK